MKRLDMPEGLVVFTAITALPFLLSSTARAQAVFSIDYVGSTISAPDGFGGVPITEGDLLTAVSGAPALGPLPVPGIDVSAGPGGLGLTWYTPCVGHPPGTPCLVEVDAVSYGQDLLAGLGGFGAGEIWFSTDAWAVGFPSGPIPNVTTESGCNDLAADLMATALPMTPGPIPPFGSIGGNTAVVDGDGLASLCGVLYPGLGVVEPTFPTSANIGDTIDAFNFDQFVAGGSGFPTTGVYFSLDGWVINPNTGVPGTGSAAANGFLEGDILHTATPGGPPAVWASAFQLGLNLSGALDDLDALAIAENGTTVFEPSQTPYDWVGGTTDMVLFSVRSGSPIIGSPDSIFGLPIEPGDILTTPLPPGFGGLSPFPGIFIAAENLGLLTNRTHGVIGDELDGLDLVSPSLLDCNGNGVYDQIDINSGFSTDINGNGVPDECEVVGRPYCYCPAGVDPCGNPDPIAGCRNSTGVGALLTASGSGSVNLDNLLLTTTQMPTFQFAMYFSGVNMIGPLPFGDGLRCAGGQLVRTNVMNTGASGSLTYGPGIASALGILPFTTRNFQCWYRDPTGPCGSTFNTSNAYSVTFTP